MVIYSGFRVFLLSLIAFFQGFNLSSPLAVVFPSILYPPVRFFITSLLLPIHLSKDIICQTHFSNLVKYVHLLVVLSNFISFLISSEVASFPSFPPLSPFCLIPQTFLIGVSLVVAESSAAAPPRKQHYLSKLHSKSFNF